MRILGPLLALFLCYPIGAQPKAGPDAGQALALGPGDLRIEQQGDGGYHLYIRAKKGLGSVLLTESTSDPAKVNDSYAYRALEKNAVNGNEPRMLDGKLLPASGDQLFLIDSSPDPDASFGKAFHIFVPWVVAWGYPWTRSGKEYIHDGSFLNVRAFSRPYADYAGGFADNPYLVRVTQAGRPLKPAPISAPASTPSATSAKPSPAAAAPGPPKPAPGTVAPVSAKPASSIAAPNLKLYIPETIAAYAEIAAESGGELRYAASDQDIASQVEALLEREKGKSLDLVLCVDTTDTMINGVAELQARLPAILARLGPEFASFRVGMVAFKDYFEEYLFKRFDFSPTVEAFDAELATLECGGGRDVPEAVYEALYVAVSEYPWAASTRLAVLVGDAPPHPLPRGSIAGPEVEEAAAASGVEISAVAVPK